MNATCSQLDSKCLQILGMHYITGSDTPSYLYGKGKVSALKTLIAGDFPGLYSASGELDATHTQLMEVGQAFFCPLYGQQQGTTMSEARYHIYTQKAGKLLKIMPLPPTNKISFCTSCALIYRLYSPNLLTTRLHLNLTSLNMARKLMMAPQY